METLEGDAAGGASEPAASTPDVIGPVALTPSFAIKESHGGCPAEIRLIYDFRAIVVNDIVKMSETEFPHDLDVFSVTLALFQRADPDCKPEAFSVDYVRAYKNVPLCRDREQFATIALTPPEGSHRAAKLSAQPPSSEWGYR